MPESIARTDYAATHATTLVADTGARRRISWGAIFAGTLIALVVQLLLSLLGIGIGLSTVNPTTQAVPTAGLGTGAAVWCVIASLVSLFAGGWVAGTARGHSPHGR